MDGRFRFFSETPSEWSEGLPVLPPTYNRVKKMLNNDWNKRNEVYAYIESMDTSFTYYQLASNAVLAGCTPDCWKIIKTCVNILIDKKFNLETVITTVHSQSPLILISGEVVNDLNIDGGRGSIGPGSRQAIVIGRAIYLFIRNILNGKPDGIDGATQGHLGKITFCFTENIELSPWEGYQVRKGYSQNESTVTIFSSQSPHEVVDMGEKSIQSLLDGLLHSLLNPWTYNSFYNQDVWLILSPEHAQRIHESGMGYDDLVEYLFSNTVFLKKELVDRGLYGFIGKVKYEEVRLFKSKENINIVVSGGYPGGYTMVCFGSGTSLTKKVVN